MLSLRVLQTTKFWQKRSLPVLVGVSISGLTLFLWQALAAQEITQIQRKGEFATVSVQQEITGHIHNRILSLARMAKRWELQGGTPQAQWYADAQNQLQDYPGFQALEWVDSSFYVRWIVPIDGNEAAQNLNLAFEERRRIALEAARERKAVTVTRTVTLVQGGKGFLVYVPLFLKNKSSTVAGRASQALDSFDGFILGVFRLQPLLDTLLDNHIAPGYAIAIFDGSDEIYCRDCSDTSRQRSSKWHHETIVNLDGISWRIKVWPTSTLLAQEQSPLPQVVLGGGLIMALLLAGVTYLAQTAQRRTRQLAREISERQQVEERKKETESILSSFFDSAPLMMGIVELVNNDILHLSDNTATAQLFGLTPEAMRHRLASEVGVPPQYVQKWITYYRRSQRTGQPVRFEYAHATEAETKWLAATVCPISNSTGNRERFCYLVEEITERKLAQEALQKQALIFETISDGVILTDLAGGIIDWNPAAEQMFGYARAEVLGQTPGILHRQEESATLTKQILDGMLRDGRWFGEVNFVRKDGTEGVCETVVLPILDQQGQLVATIGVNHDITERKQKEEVLRNITLGVSVETGEVFFQSLVEYLSKALGVEYAFVGELVGSDGDRIRTVANYGEGQLLENLEYPLVHSPCESVVGQRLRVYPRKLRQQFPLDPVLKKLGAESYLGAPMFDSTGCALGLVAVLSRKPLKNTQLMSEVLTIFAVRAGSELERQRAEAELKRQSLRAQLFAELALHIRRSLQLEEILQTTVTEVQKLLQADRVIIFQFWSEGTRGTVVQEAVVSSWSSVMAQGITNDCFDSEYLLKYPQGRIYSLPDVDKAKIPPCLIDFLHQFNVKSKLVVPILLKEELWGLLIIHQCSHPRQWSSFEIELLQQLGDQVGIALAQSQLLEALRESEGRFRTMADSAPVLLWMSDSNGQCTFFNQSWLNFTGRTIEQEIGHGWTEGIHPEDWQSTQNTYSSAFDTRQDFQREYRLRRADGEYRWVLDKGIPRFLPDGGFAGYIGSVFDISDRREVERLKDEFISVVSHELRTPLTSILGALDLLASGVLSTKPEQGQHMLKIAAKNAERLVRLINDILDIERIESGKVTMSKQMCNVEQLMNASVDVVRNVAQTAGVSLSVSPLSARLWIDPDRIIQVLTNLLGNAIKFSPYGSTVWLTAELIDGQFSSIISSPVEYLHFGGDKAEGRRQKAEVKEEGCKEQGNNNCLGGHEITDNLPQITAEEQLTVLFQIRDQGRGIPADKIETIFGRFQQVDASDSRKKGGTGLGLAVCRSIVQHHGGQIWAQSTLGEGSTFCFTLPVLQEEQVILAPESTAPLVLVCDDDPSVRTVIKAKLEQQGYQAMTVASGEETVKQAAQKLPDAILLNLMMPGMNGWETLAALKEQVNTKDIPVIILSGLLPDAREDKYSKISDWIIKPPDDKLLLQALERALTEQNRNIRVLVIEDDTDLAKVLIAVFERYGIEIYHAQTGREAIQLSQRLLPDLLVLDLVLPEYDGFAVVDWLRQHNRLYQVPLVVYTSQDLDDSDRERLKLGQTLFLTKSRITPEEFEQGVINLLNRIIRHTEGRAQP